MRKIKIESWKVNINGEEKDENILMALNLLLSSKKPEEIPRGIDKFRLFGRLSKAFEKAEKTKMLVLEESDYSFLKKMIETDVPSIWGMNSNAFKAIEDFLEAKEE